MALYASEAHGLDKNTSSVVKDKQVLLKKTIDNIFFHELDAFDISSVLQLNKKFNVIFIDISGNRAVGPVAQLIETYEKLYSPRLIIVKSFRLKKLICQSEPHFVDQSKTMIHKSIRIKQNAQRPQTIQKNKNDVGIISNEIKKLENEVDNLLKIIDSCDDKKTGLKAALCWTHHLAGKPKKTKVDTLAI
eukprot:UN24434